MSKDQELVKVKRDTKSLVMKNLIVMAVLIIIALTGVVSWFTNKSEATADGINVICQAPDGLEIAVVRHDDKKQLTDKDFDNGGIVDLSDVDKYPFLKQLSLEELTSDGRYFYKPKITQSRSGAFVDITSTEPWVNAEDAYTNFKKDDSSLSYLSVDVYMRSKGQHTITLSSSTSVTPQDKNRLIGNNILNKSVMGEFSKDCIVGAVRVSTVVKDKCNILWIPAPNILYSETKSGNGVRTDLTDGESFTHEYWPVDPKNFTRTGDKTAKDVITNTEGNYTLGKDKELLTLSEEPDEAGFHTGKVTLNLWIDGEDKEARQAFVGGKFLADFKFGLNK